MTNKKIKKKKRKNIPLPGIEPGRITFTKFVLSATADRTFALCRASLLLKYNSFNVYAIFVYAPYNIRFFCPG